ncbi:MAG TPA: hypothetical protein VHQ70_11505 [Syntrophomonadaceae bacterium]|nr:hypothetical protein [Syntrophomonadaceae bacterium]
MIKIRAFAYEYQPDGILLTVIYDWGEKTRAASEFYEGASEINFDWEEEAQKIVSRDINSSEI